MICYVIRCWLRRFEPFSCWKQRVHGSKINSNLEVDWCLEYKYIILICATKQSKRIRSITLFLAILSSTRLQHRPCPNRVPYFPNIASNVTFRKWATLFYFKTQGVVHGLNSSILNLSILIFFFNRQEGLTPSSKVSKTCSLGNLRCGKWNCGAAKTLLSLSIRYISFSFKISIMYLEKKGVQQKWIAVSMGA